METNGTTYHDETPAAVITVIEAARASGQRLHIHYGDAATGRAWGDVETGRIGRSVGRVKVPLSVHNARSMGGGAILDHCIVKIETTRAPRRILYQHPDYHLPCPHGESYYCINCRAAAGAHPSHFGLRSSSALERNPRHRAYAAAHGVASSEMVERDRKRWPGAPMCGFVFWTQDRWREWRELNGYSSDAPIGPVEHTAFDAWLAAKVAS